MSESKKTAPAVDETDIVLDTTDNKKFVKKELKKAFYYATGFVVGAVFATIVVKSGSGESSETEN